MLTAEEMRNIFSVDVDTGFLYWRINAGQRGRVGARAGATKLFGKIRYFTVSIFGKTYYTHKVVWSIHHGRIPSDQVDHINGDREDNRIENLREVTVDENVKNAKRRVDNASGLTGVYWHKTKKRWISHIGENSGIKQLGGFRDLFEACCRRKSAEIALGYHANHGRA